MDTIGRKLIRTLKFLARFIRDYRRYPEYNPIFRDKVIGWTYYPSLLSRIVWVARWGWS
jgi:hypothetical protein